MCTELGTQRNPEEGKPPQGSQWREVEAGQEAGYKFE